MADFTFKKSTCERYDIRWGQGGWATITIDENGGLFNAQSDYGSYAYAWPCHGRKSFKHYIVLDLVRDESDFLGKVAREDYFDGNKAIEQWLSEVIKIRKERDCTKEQARDAWDFINDLDTSLSPDLLQERIYESREIGEICKEPWYVFEINLEYSPMARVFARKVMPIFAAILKNEIEDRAKEKALRANGEHREKESP